MSEVIVRQMEDIDVDAISCIEEECFSMPWKPNDFRDMIKYDNMSYLVLEKNGEIIGGAGIREIVGDGEITNVAITKSERGKGYSYLLLNELLNIGRKLGCRNFTLEVRVSNEPAIKCYKRLGFVSEGVRPNFYSHPTEDALIMWIREC